MLLMFIIFSVLIGLSLSTDYCSICPNGTHTMCLFPEGPSPTCNDYTAVVMDQHMTQYIVDIHNDIREHVASGQETKGKLGKQPPAANMQLLVWNDDLAEIAQRWADQCISINGTHQHDVCKKTDQFEQIGQNILTAITNGTELPEIAILILNWYKQVSSVIPSDVDFFSGVKRGQFLIGQYTQLVWANTKYIGCGMSIYREPGSKYFNQRLVCNYGPGGNIIGQPIYEKGTPCSKCPTQRCDSFRNSLCEGTKTMSLSNLSSFAYFEKMLVNQFPVSCIILPKEVLQKQYQECLNSLDNYQDTTDGLDVMKYTNMSLKENFDNNKSILNEVPYQEDQDPLIVQREWVINLLDDKIILNENENFQKMKMIKNFRLNLNDSFSDMESDDEEKQEKPEDSNSDEDTIEMKQRKLAPNSKRPRDGDDCICYEN